MIIAFKGTRNHPGIAAEAMILTGCATMFRTNRKVFLLSLCDIGVGTPIEDVAYGSSRVNEEEDALFSQAISIDNTGIDALITRSEVGAINATAFENLVTPLVKVKHQLDIATSTRQADFESQLLTAVSAISSLFESARRVYDHIFVLLDASKPELCDQVCAMADRVVTVCPQTRGESKLSDGSKESQAREILLINDFDPESSWNTNAVAKSYGFKIAYEIPHNTGYRDAIINGAVVAFARNNATVSEKTDNNYYFSSCVGKICDAIVGQKQEEEVPDIMFEHFVPAEKEVPLQEVEPENIEEKEMTGKKRLFRKADQYTSVVINGLDPIDEDMDFLTDSEAAIQITSDEEEPNAAKRARKPKVLRSAPVAVQFPTFDNLNRSVSIADEPVAAVKKSVEQKKAEEPVKGSLADEPAVAIEEEPIEHSTESSSEPTPSVAVNTEVVDRPADSVVAEPAAEPAESIADAPAASIEELLTEEPAKDAELNSTVADMPSPSVEEEEEDLWDAFVEDDEYVTRAEDKPADIAEEEKKAEETESVEAKVAEADSVPEEPEKAEEKEEVLPIAEASDNVSEEDPSEKTIAIAEEDKPIQEEKEPDVQEEKKPEIEVIGVVAAAATAAASEDQTIRGFKRMLGRLAKKKKHTEKAADPVLEEVKGEASTAVKDSVEDLPEKKEEPLPQIESAAEATTEEAAELEKDIDESTEIPEEIEDESIATVEIENTAEDPADETPAVAEEMPAEPEEVETEPTSDELPCENEIYVDYEEVEESHDESDGAEENIKNPVKHEEIDEQADEAHAEDESPAAEDEEEPVTEAEETPEEELMEDAEVVDVPVITESVDSNDASVIPDAADETSEEAVSEKPADDSLAETPAEIDGEHIEESGDNAPVEDLDMTSIANDHDTETVDTLSLDETEETRPDIQEEDDEKSEDVDSAATAEEPLNAEKAAEEPENRPETASDNADNDVFFDEKINAAQKNTPAGGKKQKKSFLAKLFGSSKKHKKERKAVGAVAAAEPAPDVTASEKKPDPEPAGKAEDVSAEAPKPNMDAFDIETPEDADFEHLLKDEKLTSEVLNSVQEVEDRYNGVIPADENNETNEAKVDAQGADDDMVFRLEPVEVQAEKLSEVVSENIHDRGERARLFWNSVKDEAETEIESIEETVEEPKELEDAASIEAELLELVDEVADTEAETDAVETVESSEPEPIKMQKKDLINCPACGAPILIPGSSICFMCGAPLTE